MCVCIERDMVGDGGYDDGGGCNVVVVGVAKVVGRERCFGETTKGIKVISASILTLLGDNS